MFLSMGTLTKFTVDIKLTCASAFQHVAQEHFCSCSLHLALKTFMGELDNLLGGGGGG